MNWFKSRLFAVSLLLVVHAAASHAQVADPRRGGVVSGVVVDSLGTPLPASRVRIVELHREDLSHDDGVFRIRDVPAGTYTLTVMRIGYAPSSRRIVVDEGGTVTERVVLRASAVQLTAQVVTGTIGTRARDEVLSATSAISDAALDRQLSTTVAATLSNQPGVSVASIGAATARPVIRGLGGDRILILEDGQRPGDLSSTSGDHAVAIDPLTALRVEVVRGPMSLLYGSSALGGVVNVIREEIPQSVPEHARGSLIMQGESAFRGGTVGGEAQAALGRNVAMRAEASARGLGNTQTPSGVLSNTSAQTYGGAASLAFIGSHGHSGLGVRYYSNSYGIPGGFVGSHPEGVDIHMRRNSLRAETETHGSGPIAMITATTTLTDYWHEEREKTGRVGTRFGQKLATAEVLARHDIAGPFSLGAFGIRGQYRDIVTGGSLRTPSTYDYNIAAYAVEELGPERFRFQVGARMDHARYTPREQTDVAVGDRRVPVRPRNFGALSGSAGVIYRATEEIRFGASMSRAYRTPDFNELYSNGPHLAANAYEVGDPELRHETGIGADVFARITSGRLHAEVAAFRNQLNDYISSSSRGQTIESVRGRPLFQFTNEDAVFTGAEGSAQFEVTRSLVVDGVVSYVRAVFTNDRPAIPIFALTATGVDTSYVAASRYPTMVPPLGGRVEVRYERPRFSAGGGTRLVAAQNRTGDFEEPTAGFGVAHANAAYRVLRGSTLHTLTLRIDNLFNTTYREHLSRTKAIVPEAGRNISLLYRLSF